MASIQSRVNSQSADYGKNREYHLALSEELKKKKEAAAQGGGAEARKKHEERGKLFVRDRISQLLDPGTPFLELSALAANGLYGDAAPGAGLVTGIGRGAEKNDALTFHVARPRDLWLHAKSRTGAHVIVPLAKGASCPADVLVEAAHLALHFSEAKQEATIEVQYTPRRYVRKPRGSAPGLVVVDREKVMLLRRDEALLRRLLEREQT